MTSSQVQGQTPQFAALKQIAFGPVTLDGYMCDDGEFRMSMRSTARAIGCDDSKVRRLVQNAATQSLAAATDLSDSIAKTAATRVPAQTPSSASALAKSTPKTAATRAGSDKPMILALKPRAGGSHGAGSPRPAPAVD